MHYDLSSILRFKTPWNANKPDLYVDVDGVICCPYTRNLQAGEEVEGLSTHFQLRPDVVGFLRRMQKIYNVKWLTAESEDNVRDLFCSMLQAAPDVLGIEFADWGGDFKLGGVNVHRPFWILDDCLDDRSCKWLQGNDMFHRYIKVDGHAMWELARIEELLRYKEWDISPREQELRKQWKERNESANRS